MATEKATDTPVTHTTATRTPKARASRAKMSVAAPVAAPTDASTEMSTTATTTARKAPKARRTSTVTASTPDAQALSVESLNDSAAVLERALLEKEAVKSLDAARTLLPAKSAPKAHCGQCGREMRFVPFSLSNLMCRSCYGLDRYRRPAAPSLSSVTAPRPGSR